MFEENNGLLFRSLCIDPHRVPKGEKVFLSHAHSDHVKLSKKSEFFATPATIELVRQKYGEAHFSPIELNKKQKFDDFELELLPNGHMLGSAQALFSMDGKDFVFTSDFRLQDSLLFPGAVPKACDTLVLETTFGAPQYVFPKQKEVTSEMVSWIEKNSKSGLVLLAGYSLGKAQELTKISNEAGVVPIVHDSIFEANKIYEKHGVSLGDYLKLDHNLKDSTVLIMPPQLVGRHLFATLEHFDKRKISSALATGWEHRGAFDVTFPLSNHADYNDLLEYVRVSNPNLVLTDHGFCEEFSRKLNKLGYNSKPLKQHKQKLLTEY
ncbi:MAG: MBL fold metallo-hydrolase [archaeon]|jgi:Cft2 family RNA processing exonuclease